MPIHGDFKQFTQGNIERAPDRPGVYQLDTANELIYYGSSTVSIRARLASHYAGREGRCTQQATWFKTEVTSSPLQRERQLIEEYYRTYRRLPRCNNVRP